MIGTISAQVRDKWSAFRTEAAWTAAKHNVIKGGLGCFCPFTPCTTSLTLSIGLHVCTLSSLTDELRLEGERGGMGGSWMLSWRELHSFVSSFRSPTLRRNILKLRARKWKPPFVWNGLHDSQGNYGKDTREAKIKTVVILYLFFFVFTEIRY